MNYNRSHAFYCGVDRQARSMYTHVLDAQGKTLCDRDLPAEPAAFLDAVAPYRQGLVVGAASRRTRSLADPDRRISNHPGASEVR